ncbi:DnaD domain protein [Streptococcus suis]|nr:DnaD domain protein [Streptococcus suis]NQN32946.1 DnaD domain protein [Streptococcus suis]NQO51225.1 DnaD domain protein [Streptococcus suis]NQP51390.1 DnaD domain protein [Streptococcus suis]
MAQRRMFSKEITTSDHFVDMPQSTQLLYFHLGMEADDEGFIGNARMLSRAYGANSDDLKLLQAKGFIIIFESGVTVVKDWNLNNQIRKDRLKPTIYQAEKSLLTLDNTGVYQLDNQMTTKPQPNDNQMTTKPQPNDNQLPTKCPHRLGKDRIGEVSIGEQQLGAGAEKNIIFEKLKEAFGEMSISGTITNEANDLVAVHGQDLLLYALDETILNGGRSIRYTRSILERWQGEGLRTVEQIKNSRKKKKDDWVPDYPAPY